MKQRGGSALDCGAVFFVHGGQLKVSWRRRHRSPSQRKPAFWRCTAWVGIYKPRQTGCSSARNSILDVQSPIGDFLSNCLQAFHSVRGDSARSFKIIPETIFVFSLASIVPASLHTPMHIPRATTIHMADLELRPSSSDSDSDSVVELSIVPTTQSSARSLKRKREGMLYFLV